MFYGLLFIRLYIINIYLSQCFCKISRKLKSPGQREKFFHHCHSLKRGSLTFEVYIVSTVSEEKNHSGLQAT